MKRISCLPLFVSLAVSAFPLSSYAHGTEEHAKGAKAAVSTEEHPFGREGDPKKARRTINLSMDDTMRYSTSQIRVAQGETVTFVLANKGKLLHELVIGTKEELEKHAEMMRANPGMEHEEPYMAHVKPGGSERLTWTFTKAGTFEYGCLVAGHFEAGMKGTIVVAAR
ncbi:MAG: cupredoxin family protein [Casimicrobiaceae bacterium]